jgi:MFS transporter, DHA2 family, multidrug resistance protein
MISAESRKWWALGAISFSLLAVGLDLTILNVALPTVATSLHASTSQLQWFADAYSLVLAAMLLPAGLLGDRFGRKRVLLGGLALFGLASLACSFAGSPGALIAARALLGLGAAVLMPLSIAILPVLFDAHERPRAMGVWVTANSIGIPLGPILGGWLLDNYRWGSVFLINVPLVIIGLIAVAVLVPESRNPRRPRLDLVGVLASSLGLAGVTYGVIEAGERGWGDPRALLTLVAGALVLVGFVLWERHLARRPDGSPLVDLALFRSRGFTRGAILATLISFALFGVLFAMPQFFQAVAGTDALHTGLRILPIMGGLLVGARAGARIAERLGGWRNIVLGLELLTAALLAGATTTVDTGYGFTATWLVVIGLGLGFALPSAMDAALSALSADRAGVGSALVMALRQVGGTIGVAILGTVLGSAYRADLPASAGDAVRDSAAGGVAVAHRLDSAALLADVQHAFAHGLDVMLLVCAGIAAAGVVLALVFLPRRSAAGAAESPHELVA